MYSDIMPRYLLCCAFCRAICEFQLVCSFVNVGYLSVRANKRTANVVG